VVLGVATLADLRITVERARLSGIRIALFHEPDHDLGFTAACTEPLTGSIRRVFHRLSLWREPVTHPPARGPPIRAVWVPVQSWAERENVFQSTRLPHQNERDGS
jgi:hypothetical protein